MSQDISTLINDSKLRIEKDLRPFIDPGTTLTLSIDGRSIRANWIQRTMNRDAIFTVSYDAISVHFNNQKYTYKSFFSTPEMADLLGIAKMILQVRTQKIFVPTKATRVSDEIKNCGDAIEILRNALYDRTAEDATLVVMVTGEAGSGKTSVLQEMVRSQAYDYIRGQTDCLLLYVNAQGRALARFNEALATELQDLRATLTYHAISTLVRLGIVIPIIDGFDELLGVGGYDDAFSSLASFIEELDGYGQIIASARSTYYEQEFVTRANRVSSLGRQIWKQISIQVQSWGDEELLKYVNMRCKEKNVCGDDYSNMLKKVNDVFKGPNGILKNKPLFVARTVDLLLLDFDLSGSGDLLDELVNAYIERERIEKLLDKTGNPMLTSQQIKDLLVELSEEMWNQETRELDRRSVKEVAEYIMLNQNVDDVTQQVVIERMTSMAFLTPGEHIGSISFEHETFFSYFLAHRFAVVLMSKETSPSLILGRSVLPADLPIITIRIIKSLNNEIGCNQITTSLANAGSIQTPRTPQVRENSGVIVSTLLKYQCSTNKEETEIILKNLIIPGGDWDKVVLNNCFLENVEFRRVDLSNTQILKSKSNNIVLLEPLVDPLKTKLELDGFDETYQIYGIRVIESSGVRTLYDPSELHGILKKIGLAGEKDINEHVLRKIQNEAIDLVQRFVRAFNRSNPVCTSDENMMRVFGHHYWNDIQKILVTSGVVSEEYRDTKKEKKIFLRRQVLPEEIMAGLRRDSRVPNQVKIFWEQMERIYPLK